MIRRALIGAAVAGALIAPATAADASSTAGKPPPSCNNPNVCLLVYPTFPGAIGTAAIPNRRINRSSSLNSVLGEPAAHKWPMVQWQFRYSNVFKRPPLWKGFQSGSFDNKNMAVSVEIKCEDPQGDGGSGGGYWNGPTIVVGSGGNPFQKKKEVQVDPNFVCDGYNHVAIIPKYFRLVDAGYGEPYRAAYFDVRFPNPEELVVITVVDDTWLYNLSNVAKGPFAIPNHRFGLLPVRGMVGSVQ